jgi:hypothetical protein
MMGRELPYECPHGMKIGGDESFGYQNNVCDECEAEAFQCLITRRDRFAMAAMAGLLANPSERWQVAIVANIAVNHADALIGALNEGKT